MDVEREPPLLEPGQVEQVIDHGQQPVRILPGGQEELVASSDRFFRPPYVGHRGWVGVRLDGEVDWAEVAEVLEDAYRAVAPARLRDA